MSSRNKAHDAQSEASGLQTVGGFHESGSSPTSIGDIKQRNRAGSVHSVRSSTGGKVRQSFAAALWNPMKDTDKYEFNKKRLIQLFSGVLIATCGGSAFAFGIFSNKIKESAHFTQSDMTTITTSASILGSFTFPAGIIFDYAGPQYVLACATVLCCTGFGLLSLIFEGRVEANVYSVSAANAITSLGVGFTDGGSLLTNLFNFPINRGEVLIIQKTFFGLGATFLSLIFDGFFGPSENYLGYAITVTVMMFCAGVFGTLVFRLPIYKRTSRDLNRIAKLDDPLQKEMERQAEERAFEMFHNPRLVDRRRLNAGVTVLLFTLTFFCSFSVIKTYVVIPSDVITGLTVLACLCMAAFSIMILPFNLPAFFDYEFLPDLHPPEALVDKPEDEDDAKKDASATRAVNGSIAHADTDDIDSVSRGREYETAPLIANNNNNNNNYDDYTDGVRNGEEGRASNFLAQRQSIAGNSAPIAVPQAIAPSVVPSITTGFMHNILRPMLWALWIMAFTISAISVLIGNQAQIMSSANDGVVDKKSNSLAVALMGIGSASGRIIIGFCETYTQRRNALAREEQLKWEAENGPYDPTQPALPGQPDMRPIFHRWSSSVTFLVPFCPAVLTVCCFIFTVAPVSSFPVLYVFLTTAYGAWIALLALCVREMFSVDTAKHFNFIFTSGIAASLLLNRLMFGVWYDKEQEKHPAPDGIGCAGYTCFSSSCYVIGGLCALAVLTCTYISLGWLKVRRTF